MQLLVFITNHSEHLPRLLSAFTAQGVSGATIVNCEGMLHMLAACENIEKPAFFSKARSLFDDSGEQGKMVLAVMPDERVADSKEAIRQICGDFDRPNTGIMFTLPVMHFEGVTRK